MEPEVGYAERDLERAQLRAYAQDLRNSYARELRRLGDYVPTPLHGEALDAALARWVAPVEETGTGRSTYTSSGRARWFPSPSRPGP